LNTLQASLAHVLKDGQAQADPVQMKFLEESITAVNNAMALSPETQMKNDIGFTG